MPFCVLYLEEEQLEHSVVEEEGLLAAGTRSAPGPAGTRPGRELAADTHRPVDTHRPAAAAAADSELAGTRPEPGLAGIHLAGKLQLGLADSHRAEP